jgi:hypothetical protein
MASRDTFELPGGRICRISGIDLMSIPFEGVMYRGHFLPVSIAGSRMDVDKLKKEEIGQRLSSTHWGFTLTMRGGTEVPVIGTSKTNTEGWHHQLKGVLLN